MRWDNYPRKYIEIEYKEDHIRGNKKYLKSRLRRKRELSKGLTVDGRILLNELKRIDAGIEKRKLAGKEDREIPGDAVRPHDRGGNRRIVKPAQRDDRAVSGEVREGVRGGEECVGREGRGRDDGSRPGASAVGDGEVDEVKEDVGNRCSGEGRDGINGGGQGCAGDTGKEPDVERGRFEGGGGAGAEEGTGDRGGPGPWIEDYNRWPTRHRKAASKHLLTRNEKMLRESYQQVTHFNVVSNSRARRWK